jgi:hypothetical protein
MESNSEAMRIHISTDTFQLLQVRVGGGRVEGGLARRLGTDDFGANRTGFGCEMSFSRCFATPARFL